MKKQILKSTHEGVLRIGNSELDVAVLEDGTRIITQSAVFRASDRPPRATTRLILLLAELIKVINHLRVVGVIHAYITLCNTYIRVSHELRYKHNIFSV